MTSKRIATKLVAAALFAATAGVVAVFPLVQASLARAPIESSNASEAAIAPQRPRVEAVFVLDTTGSMGGLIEAAKEKIWSIATTLASANQAPEVKLGLVAYRDRGDVYVTRVTDLSSDLDSVYATLMDFRAEGGGDTPESVNRALHDAVHSISWSQDQQTYRVVFLVGDAPPHMDYQDELRYPQVVADARRRGIVVNAIRVGQIAATRGPWRQIAQLGDGRYFDVDSNGSAVALTTPYDERLAELSKRLDATRLYYGTEEQRAEKARKSLATGKLHRGASVATRARRAQFNVTPSGAVNLFGDNELVDDVSSGRVALEALAPETLPEPMQAIPPAERQALIDRTAHERAALKREIDGLAKQRADFLERKVGELGGATESLDQKIYDTVRDQASEAGLSYELDAPSY